MCREFLFSFLVRRNIKKFENYWFKAMHTASGQASARFARVCFFVLFAIFILHSRESELYRYTLDGKSALAWELPFLRFMGHLSST